MKLTKVESIYEGRCFKRHDRHCGAFIVHQVWERQSNKTKIALIEDLQTNKLSTISLRTVYRRHAEKKEIKGDEKFYCKKCKGTGTNRRKDEYCNDCDGFGEIWIEPGTSGPQNLVVSRPKKRFSFNWLELI